MTSRLAQLQSTYYGEIIIFRQDSPDYKICVLVGTTQPIILCVMVSQNVNNPVAKLELRTPYEFSIILSP